MEMAYDEKYKYLDMSLLDFTSLLITSSNNKNKKKKPQIPYSLDILFLPSIHT